MLLASRLLTMFSSKKLFVDQLPLNPYLKEGLKMNNILQLKPFQDQALKASEDGKNCFINSCTGSGKTLAYLLPILNKILTKKQENNGTQQQHGAVILTLNKQLCLQVYTVIRKLDYLTKLSVKRTGPITHYIPVITQLGTPPKTKEQADLIDAKINANLVNSVKWDTTDILISTPQLLYNIWKMTKNKNLKPAYFVIDEADLLLETDRNVRKHTFMLLDQIQGKGRERKLQKNIQFFMSASSFPNKIGGKDSLQVLNGYFRGKIQAIEGQQKHEIPENIELFFIETYQYPHPKLSYIGDILKKNREERIIIFCNNKKSIEEVSQFITEQFNESVLQYHASLDSNERSRVLHRFDTEGSRILVASDLASRGLDFCVPIHLIIEYQMAENITGFLNRVGRTGRNNLHGKVITMVEEKNKQFFEHLSQLVLENQGVDELFSRKRSYRKLYKE